MPVNETDGPSTEMLMAFADDALEGAERTGMAAYVAANPQAAAVVAQMRASRDLLARTFQSAGAEPVPQRLIDAIMVAPIGASAAAANAGSVKPGRTELAHPGLAGKVVPISVAVGRRTATTAARADTGSVPRRMAMAASLAAVAALGGGLLTRQALRPSEAAGTYARSSAGWLMAAGDLARVLSTESGGSRVALKSATVQPVLTFRSKAGTVCRQFLASTQGASTQGASTQGAGQQGSNEIGVACLQPGGGWRIEMLANAGPSVGAGTKVVPAGRSGSPELDALIDRLIDGDLLDRDQERAALGTP